MAQEPFTGDDLNLLADRAYDSNALCERLAERGAWGNFRAMPQRNLSTRMERLAEALAERLEPGDTAFQKCDVVIQPRNQEPRLPGVVLA